MIEFSFAQSYLCCYPPPLVGVVVFFTVSIGKKGILQCKLVAFDLIDMLLCSSSDCSRIDQSNFKVFKHLFSYAQPKRSMLLYFVITSMGSNTHIGKTTYIGISPDLRKQDLHQLLLLLCLNNSIAFRKVHWSLQPNVLIA